MSSLWCPRMQGYLDTYKHCILRSSPLPQLYNKHPLLAQELLAGFSSSYCVTFLFQQEMLLHDRNWSCPIDMHPHAQAERMRAQQIAMAVHNWRHQLTLYSSFI